MTDDTDNVIPIKGRGSNPKSRANLRKPLPTSGMPAGGPGWGGSANGSGAGVEALIPGQSAEKRTVTDYNRLSDEQVAAQMRGVLYNVATSSDFDMARIAASDKLLNRIEGTPVSRTVLAGDPNAPLVPERRTLDLNQLNADQRDYLRNVLRIAASDAAVVIEGDEVGEDE